MGGEDPKKALEGILQSPKDHTFITKAIKEQMKANPDKESLPYVPPVEQLELVLWCMLPSTEDALKSFTNTFKHLNIIPLPEQPILKPASLLGPLSLEPIVQTTKQSYLLRK